MFSAFIAHPTSELVSMLIAQATKDQFGERVNAMNVIMAMAAPLDNGLAWLDPIKP